jgi:hypothetical protein
MPGAQCTHSLACKINKAHERSHHRFTGTPGIPARNGFTAYFALSPATRLYCHRRLRIKASSLPGRADKPPRNLTPASGRQNHTTSPSASAPFVCAPVTAHGFKKPALRSLRARGHCRVHRIPPRVRDDRDTPLVWDETSRDMHLIWVSGEGKYFCKRGWTGHFGKHEVICPSGNLGVNP